MDALNGGDGVRVLLVCTGNTCRSAMASCYLKARRPDWEVRSAGIRARSGELASKNASLVMKEEGLDLSGHRATSLRLLATGTVFDRVLVMEPSHLSFITFQEPELLSALVGEAKGVSDPYGGGLETYRKVFFQIRAYLDALLEKSEGDESPPAWRKNVNSDIVAERLEYGDRPLEEADLDGQPLGLIQAWLAEAVSADIPEANGANLATVDEEGRPDSRIVLVKEFDEKGLIFYTNYRGRKALQLESVPQACLVFWWQALRRQVRVSGTVEKVEPGRSDAYFASRPREAQLGAWASLQSEPMENRQVLEERLKEIGERFPGEVPRPEHWGGYRVRPQRVEFWQGRTSRLHDRFVMTSEGGEWRLQRLMP